MAGTPTPTATKADQPSLADVYDIGEPDLDAALPAEPVPPSEPKPAAPAEPAAQPAEQARRADGTFGHKHPRYLLHQAKDLGMDPAEVAALSTDELGEAVAAQAAWAVGRARQDTLRNSIDQPRQAPEPLVRREPESAAEEIDWGQDESGRKLSDRDYLPPIAGAIRTTRALEKRIAELEKRLGDLGEREVRREANSHFDRVDQTFAKLNDLEAVLGKGGRHDLERESPEMQRRMAVLESAKRLAGENATLEQQLAKVPQAARLLFGDRPAAAPEKPDRAAVERWNEAATARPTHREGALELPKGKAAAVKAVAQALRDRNGTGGSVVTEEDFPE